MKIRTILFTIALAVMVLLIYPLVALAQEPTEAGYVRGHLSQDSNIWRADDFGWFYYDLDNDQGGEQLRIDVQGRLAEEGHIVYSSKTWSKQFEYKPWGSYDVVALFGKLYLAGYPDSSLTDEISSLENGDLSPILLDEDKTHTLTTNASLPLLDGYVLRLLEVSEKNGAANVVLYKDGNPVYAAALGIGDTFVYKIDDVPIILFHLVNAMMGNGIGFAEIDAVFQVSDEPSIKLVEGAKIGIMELYDFSLNGIELRNDKSLSFMSNIVLPLMDNLAIVVLDQPELVYYPMGIIYDFGIHEIRGTSYTDRSFIPVRLGGYNSSSVARWNSLNYSGFYFDPKNSLGAENLVIYAVNDRKISLPPTKPVIDEANNTAVQEGFQYTTLAQPKEFEFKPWGSYFVMSFLGDQWFIGYDSGLEKKRESKNLLEHEYLGRVLIDQELQGRILAGDYSLYEGYEMRVRDVGNDSIFLELLKDKTMVDSSVVKSNSTYIYEKDLGDVIDMPIIMIHLGNVFNNGTESFAIIDGIFQISDQYLLPVEPGRGIGELEIVYVQPNVIVMINNGNINLNRDSAVSIGPALSIRVADNDTLRYYLYNSQYVVPAPKSPLIRIPKNITSHKAANFSMIIPAAELRQVLVTILDSSNRTILSRDVTNLAQGSGELWSINWTWNATTFHLSDDNCLVLDAGEDYVPALLYLNPSAPPVEVGVIFGFTGRIVGIMNRDSIFYASRSEYKKLKVDMDYDSMLSNDTARKEFLKVEPGTSMLQFLDNIDGQFVPDGTNHTITGTLDSLEPHILVAGTNPGKYELRVRVENAVNAIQAATGDFFDVAPEVVRGVSLGSTRISDMEIASIPLHLPSSSVEKGVEISYDPSAVTVKSVTSSCHALWENDPKHGMMSVTLPDGCSVANLTFVPKKTNATTYLNITGTRGFKPETMINGTITILPGDKSNKKSNATGVLAAIFAFVFGAYARRRF